MDNMIKEICARCGACRCDECRSEGHRCRNCQCPETVIHIAGEDTPLPLAK